jgi:hypothetical protein
MSAVNDAQPPTSGALRINMAPFPEAAVADFGCPACGGRMDVYQPHPADPDRLVGSCWECHSLYVIDVFVDQQAATVVQVANGASSARSS